MDYIKNYIAAQNCKLITFSVFRLQQTQHGTGKQCAKSVKVELLARKQKKLKRNLVHFTNLGRLLTKSFKICQLKNKINIKTMCF